MSFRITGLEPALFQHLYGLSDEALARHGARRVLVDQSPGVPDRIELRDVAPGESAILLNHGHQPADTPYRASHAIFIREGAKTAHSAIDMIPESLLLRPISLRAFDAGGEMVDADLADGTTIEALIEHFFANPAVAYLHAHYTRHGCYAARIDRA